MWPHWTFDVFAQPAAREAVGINQSSLWRHCRQKIAEEWVGDASSHFISVRTITWERHTSPVRRERHSHCTLIEGRASVFSASALSDGFTVQVPVFPGDLPCLDCISFHNRYLLSVPEPTSFHSICAKPTSSDIQSIFVCGCGIIPKQMNLWSYLFT